MFDIASQYWRRIKGAPPKVAGAPANNEHGHILLKVGSSITRMAQQSAGARKHTNKLAAAGLL